MREGLGKMNSLTLKARSLLRYFVDSLAGVPITRGVLRGGGAAIEVRGRFARVIAEEDDVSNPGQEHAGNHHLVG